MPDKKIKKFRKIHLDATLRLSKYGNHSGYYTILISNFISVAALLGPIKIYDKDYLANGSAITTLRQVVGNL